MYVAFYYLSSMWNKPPTQCLHHLNLWVNQVVLQKSSPLNFFFQLVLLFISSSSPLPNFSTPKSGLVAPKHANMKLTPWPFAVVLKKMIPFTSNDGIMQHLEQTSITQSFYPNLWCPDGRKQLSSRRPSRELCAMGHFV